LKVTFLGTGTSQGVPVIACDCRVCTSLDFRDNRLRSSVHISHVNISLVIDTGPDFRQQMLRERIKSLDAVLFTHEHKDHTAGLDDIRSYNFHQSMDMPVYGRIHVLDQLKREFAYIFSDKKYPGIPRIKTIEIDKEAFEIEGLKIIPIDVLHYKLPVLGFRIDDFVYITDANFISNEEKQKCLNAKILVLNALQTTPHISHFTLEEAIELGHELKAESVLLYAYKP
jgi:phosphoribosyl 1,2-cyclic phosphate phosphodiesterase